MTTMFAPVKPVTVAPLSAVLTAIRDGARSLAEVAKATGLDHDMVRTLVDHLVRTRRLIVRELAAGCSSGSCGECAVSQGCGSGPGLALRQLVVAPSLVLRS